MNLMPEFKIGDQVTFCSYPDQMNSSLKAIVKEVILDQAHQRIFYRVSGDVVSYTTGQSLKESKLFIPFGITFNMINERQLVVNHFKSDWLTDSCYVYKFENSNQEILLRLDSQIVDLLGADGKVWQSISYGDL